MHPGFGGHRGDVDPAQIARIEANEHIALELQFSIATRDHGHLEAGGVEVTAGVDHT
ncbi:hypothetical protein [Nocardia sp. AB354]|uniref:hypothetical protein n=1 Tax=Nocardia sp. AB354 TaxID=3413283 RepID=UPI003C175740